MGILLIVDLIHGLLDFFETVIPRSVIIRLMEACMTLGVGLPLRMASVNDNIDLLKKSAIVALLVQIPR